MPFQDFDAFSDRLRLPISGKVYVVPPCTAELGLQITLTPEKIPGKIADLYKLLLGGDLWDEMVKDGVPWDALQRAGLTALADVQFGRDMAETVWEAGINPEALAARAAAKTAGLASTLSPSTGEATSTPSPASMTGTTSPKGMGRTPRKKATRRV